MVALTGIERVSAIWLANQLGADFLFIALPVTGQSMPQLFNFARAAQFRGSVPINVQGSGNAVGRLVADSWNRLGPLLDG